MNVIFERTFNLNKCIYQSEKSQSYGFCINTRQYTAMCIIIIEIWNSNHQLGLGLSNQRHVLGYGAPSALYEVRQ